MEPQESWYEGAQGERLFLRAWRPAGKSRAAAIFLHGLGDHSGLYPMIAETLVPCGLAVYAPDLRGNGRSPGPRGHVDSWSDFREDLHRLVARVRPAEPGAPLFLLGNSLGGLIVLDYALGYPGGLRGVMALSPPLGEIGVPPALLALGRIASRIWPRFSLETGMDLTGLSRDPEVVRGVLADPLFHRRGTARLSTEVVGAIARVQEQAPRFPLPVLVMHGSADRMVRPDGSRRFIHRVGHPDKELIEYDGSYHALLADFDRERVLADLSDWIGARL
ncbi:MAG TPA: alpha/beta hydrolase [Gemmatimonadales bacterium]|nr:alpha/beta hydrolase [Gemmatimonadales bacterium]